MANSGVEKHSNTDEKCEVQLESVSVVQHKAPGTLSWFSKIKLALLSGFGKAETFKHADLSNKNSPPNTRKSEAKVTYEASADSSRSEDQHLQSQQFSTPGQKSPPSHKKPSKESKKGFKNLLPKKTKKNKKPKDSEDIESQAPIKRSSESSGQSSESHASGTEVPVESPQLTTKATVTTENELDMAKKRKSSSEYKTSRTKKRSIELSLSEENQCEDVQSEQIPAVSPRHHKKSTKEETQTSHNYALRSKGKIAETSLTATSSGTSERPIQKKTKPEKLPEDKQNELRKTSISKHKKTDKVSNNQKQNQQEKVPHQTSSSTEPSKTLEKQTTENLIRVEPDPPNLKEIETQTITETCKNQKSNASSLKQETHVENFVQEKEFPETTESETCQISLPSGKTEPSIERTQEEKEKEKAFIQAASLKIASIMEEVQDVENEMEDFVGTSADHPDYVYMDEVMMRSLIKLDNVETKNNKDVRQERKKGIQYIQSTLEKLDKKLKENKDNEKKNLINSEEVNEKDREVEETQHENQSSD